MVMIGRYLCVKITLYILRYHNGVVTTRYQTNVIIDIKERCSSSLYMHEMLFTFLHYNMIMMERKNV